MRGLIVGINKYLPPNTLRGCVTDAKRWHDLIALLYGCPDIRVLLNSDATAREIRKLVLEEIRATQPGDQFLFIFAGHGDITLEGESTICPVDYDGSEANSVTATFFREAFEHLDSKAQATCIFDSCHSGSMGRHMRAGTFRTWGPTRGRVLGGRSIREALFTRGVTSLNGCTLDGNCEEASIDGLVCGAFSHYMTWRLALASGRNLSQKGLISTVASDLSANGFQQFPQIAASPEAKASAFLSHKKI